MEDVVRIVEEINKLKKELLVGSPTIQVFLERGVIVGSSIGTWQIAELDDLLDSLGRQMTRLRRLKKLFLEFRKYKEIAADLVGILKAMEEFERVRGR